jgi:GTPase SAR1 family protein
MLESGKARDEGLRNDRSYHYLICCAYRPDSTTTIISSGVRLEVKPDRLPELAEGFTVEAQGQTIVCAWSPPTHGQVIIRRVETPHDWKKGDRLTADEVYRLGEEISVSGPNQAIDVSPDVHTPYYSLFTISGSHAIAGETIAGGICPDVRNLQLSTTRDGITLCWEWPLGCNAVRVARRADAWPEGPHDRHAKVVPYTRQEYTVAGEKFVDIIQAGRGEYHYIVYAQAAPIASNVFFAPATDPGCRGMITWERGMTLRYSLSAAGEKTSRRQEMHLTWSTENPLPDFAGFTLVAQQKKVPLAADDGIELFRWEPGENQEEGDYEDWVSLKPIQRKKWDSFYCKVILREPDQHETVLIIHPNTGIPISKTGKMYLPKKDKNVPHYTFGVPKTIICSRCFEEFPLNRMLFTSYDGVNQVSRTARYTGLHRLLHKPLKPPTTKHGKLARKLCPKCKKDLPRTAGTQSNLVIGLVGAKFSGKSHYIASLIKRLKTPVCSDDLPAALLPASDETQERYQKEFHDKLFKNHLELPVTIGTPEPLIYDFSLDGVLWDEERNREVTLSLYETAGENFDKTERVREMVSYLRVASGIIFLLDPLQVEKTRAILQSSQVALPDKDQMADPNMIIGRVLQELETGNVISADGTLATPVAVVLTKCDVLRDARLLETHRLWHTEKRHIDYFDSEAHADMTGMMGQYVQEWMPDVYQTVRQRFSNYAFFGVSATGCASDAMTRRYQYIAPWRVEEPVLWLLAELDVIPTR